jgi:hypothetical protein
MSTQPQPLPYGDSRFDRFQFDGKCPKAISAKTCIAFSDFVFMGVQRRSRAAHRKLGVPAWVVEDKQFREVILLHAERRLHIHPPEDAAHDERMFAIRQKEKATAASLARQLNQFIEKIEAKDPDAPGEIQVRNLDRQLVVYGRGILEVSTAVAYKSYRLGADSPEVAEELQMSPCGVRQMLRRLNNAAKVLSGELPPRRITDTDEPSAETVNRRKAKKYKHWDKHWELGAPKTPKVVADEKRQRKCALLREHARKRALQRERGRRYRQRHPGRRSRPSIPSEQRVQRRRECRRKYYWANRERILATQQAARDAKAGPKLTAEEKLARKIAKRKAWVEAHREELREYYRNWRAKNREKIRVDARRYYRQRRSLRRVAATAASEGSGLQKTVSVAAVQNTPAGQNIHPPELKSQY